MSEIPNNTPSFFDRIAGHAIAGIIFLTPFFFLPFFGVSTYSAKFFLVYVKDLSAKNFKLW
jgi:hypothetical protein